MSLRDWFVSEPPGHLVTVDLPFGWVAERMWGWIGDPRRRVQIGYPPGCTGRPYIEQNDPMIEVVRVRVPIVGCVELRRWRTDSRDATREGIA